MIHEITQFIDYLEKNSSDIFSENLELKEGLYVFLEKEGDELVIKNRNILKVYKKTEQNKLYDAFLSLTINTEMLNAMKSFNSGHKIYIAIGSPFGISISGLGLKKGLNKRLDAADAYFKAAAKYIDKENEKHINWMNELKHFVNTKMFDYIENTEKYRSLKKADMFYFFLKEPELKDYQEIQSRFLSEKLFNKDKFNIKTEKGEIYGISDNLSGFNDSKEFLKHKTAPLDLNYRVNGLEAMKLYKFFRLQQKNKILPNPMPLFVDKKELTEKAIKFYKNDKKAGHKEIVEHLLENREKDLQNYYLIFFHNGLKGSRIVDLDFVPVFKYNTNDMPKIMAIFKMTSKKDGESLRDYSIKNIFHFQAAILNKIFNNQLIIETKNGLWIKYFDDMEPKPEYGNATDTIVDLFYKYRKAFYDFVYKSKRQVITLSMFDDMMKNSILDDIRHDKDNDKTYRIKEKLNIWFSLYNYFNNNTNLENMASKIPELIERCKLIANNDNEYLSSDPKEFAFAAGQIIYFLLDKSEAGNKTHAMLEPFLQKIKAEHLQTVIGNTIGVYKHAIDFGKGRFERLSKEVLAYETDTNMKELQRFVLAGYFAEPVIYEKKAK
jgi:CRISPR-associated protein Csh1